MKKNSCCYNYHDISMTKQRALEIFQKTKHLEMPYPKEICNLHYYISIMILLYKNREDNY